MAHAASLDALEKVASEAIECCFRVHCSLRPGLLESVYEDCVACELERASIPFRRQVAIPSRYGELNIERGLVVDLSVDRSIIFELKAVEEFHSVDQAQPLTYLRLSKCRLGFLINFNTKLLKEWHHPESDLSTPAVRRASSRPSRRRGASCEANYDHT